MAPRIWQGVLLAELGLAAAVAWPIAAAIGGPMASPLAAPLALRLVLAIVALACLQSLLVLVPFVLGRRATKEGYGGLSARAVAAESLAILLSVLAMSTPSSGGELRRRGRGPRAASPGAGATSRPVLLLHGFLCNGGIWRGLERKLFAAGFTEVHVIQLRPTCADLEVHAARVARKLLAIQREVGGARVAIVAHSMGGLVARAALRAVGPQVVSCIVTLATPHHGTAIAYRLPFPPTRQMCPDSPWLRRLNGDQEGRLDAPLASFFSLADALVSPARSAELSGAHVVCFRDLGHMSLVTSARAHACILDLLMSGQEA